MHWLRWTGAQERREWHRSGTGRSAAVHMRHDNVILADIVHTDDVLLCQTWLQRRQKRRRRPPQGEGRQRAHLGWEPKLGGRAAIEVCRR